MKHLVFLIVVVIATSIGVNINHIAMANNPDVPVRQELLTTTYADSVLERLSLSDSPVLFYNVPLNHDLMTQDSDGFVTISPEQKTFGYVSFSCFGWSDFVTDRQYYFTTCGPLHSEGANDGDYFYLTDGDIERLMADGSVSAAFSIDHP